MKFRQALNPEGKLLLQQRVDDKYHSAGLWTNTCCSHPRFGEELNIAGKRCLKEEMGLTFNVNAEFSFIYKTNFDNGLIEYEFDHVYFGISNQVPEPDSSEVKNYKYISLQKLKDDLLLQPQNYTEWLKICFNKIEEHHKMFFRL